MRVRAQSKALMCTRACPTRVRGNPTLMPVHVRYLHALNSGLLKSASGDERCRAQHSMRQLESASAGIRGLLGARASKGLTGAVTALDRCMSLAKVAVLGYSRFTVCVWVWVWVNICMRGVCIFDGCTYTSTSVSSVCVYIHVYMCVCIYIYIYCI